MALIELSMKVHTEPGRPSPEVRAFIDLRPEQGLGSEIELPLRRRGKREWIGTFAIGEIQPRHFLYRIALAAHIGASWELVIRERGADGSLLCDADTLSLAKCWLVGSCDAPCEQRQQHPAHGAPSDEIAPPRSVVALRLFDSARGATACRLLLASTLGATRHLALERLQAAQDGEPKHDRTGHATEQQRLFVLGQLSDQGVRPLDERTRKSQRDDGGV
jgi:hypothetical protein